MNRLYQVEITDLAFGGEGIGRIDNMVCFVPFTAPGDVVQVEITQRKKKFLRAKAVSFISQSSERVSPPCPYFGECGGCQWQHIGYQQQLESKRSHLEGILLKTAGVEISVPPPIPSPVTYEYRRTARFKIDAAGEVGFFREHSNTLVPIDKCVLMEPVINKILPRIKRDIPSGSPLEAEVVSEEGVEADYSFLYQGDHSKRGFLQTNRHINRSLQQFIYRHVKNNTRPGDMVLDLFCGDGNLSIPLGELGVRVTGYDISRPAIEKARRSIPLSVPSHSREGGFSYRRAPFQKILSTISTQSPDIRAALFDPPRQGLSGKAGRIAEMGFPLVLYVSCSPPVLARDLRFFLEAGYELLEIQPMDMFPHTYHLETAVALRLPAKE